MVPALTSKPTKKRVPHCVGVVPTMNPNSHPFYATLSQCGDSLCEEIIYQNVYISQNHTYVL